MIACNTCRLASPDGNQCCLPCWKKRKGYTLTKSDLAFIALQEAIAAQGRPEGEGYDTLDAISPVVVDPTMPPERVKGLLLLCHPDRHPAERQEAAHEVTAWLLTLRGKK
jgi:hypothetical protein